MKQTVFFDMGNVLVSFDAQKMYTQLSEICRMTIPEILDIVQYQIDPYEKGLMDTNEIHRQFCHKANREIDIDALRLAISDIFTPNDAVIAIAEELKAKGVPLFILSNTCEAHFEFIAKQFSFLKLFDGYVLSYQVGARKPESLIYEKAIAIAGCEKNHCFYVDDIPEFVNAAKVLKIDAEQFTTAENLRSHLYQRNIL